MRVLVIFARHGTVQYASALADYRARLHHQLPGIELEWLLVDTARRLPREVATESGTRTAWDAVFRGHRPA